MTRDTGRLITMLAMLAAIAIYAIAFAASVAVDSRAAVWVSGGVCGVSGTAAILCAIALCVDWAYDTATSEVQR